MWGVPLLEEVPIPGSATRKDWKDTAEGTTKLPGRNNPKVGRWFAEKYYTGPTAADPMLGAGGFFLYCKDIFKKIYGCDVEDATAKSAAENLTRRGFTAEVQVDSARRWRPSYVEKREEQQLIQYVTHYPKVHFVITSPPFPQNKSAGGNNKQQTMVKDENLEIFQNFGSSTENIANMDEIAKKAALWETYLRIPTYLKEGGHAVVVLRNHFREGAEIDFTGWNIGALRRETGLEFLGVHPREIYAVGYQAKKLKKDPMTRYNMIEWNAVLLKKKKTRPYKTVSVLPIPIVSTTPEAVPCGLS